MILVSVAFERLYATCANRTLILIKFHLRLFFICGLICVYANIRKQRYYKTMVRFCGFPPAVWPFAECPIPSRVCPLLIKLSRGNRLRFNICCTSSVAMWHLVTCTVAIDVPMETSTKQALSVTEVFVCVTLMARSVCLVGEWFSASDTECVPFLGVARDCLRGTF